MSVTSTTAPGTLAPPVTPTTVGFRDLNSEDFFALMIAELQAQDPLKPQDNQQLLSQMSNIREIEQSTRLADSLEAQMKALETQTDILQNLSTQKFGDPASLIGLYVLGPGVDESGEPVTGDDGAQASVEGVVIGIDYSQDGEAILKLHTGDSILADKVEKVKLVIPDEEGEGPTGTNDPPTSRSADKLKLFSKSPTMTISPGKVHDDSLQVLLDSLLAPGGSVQMGL